MKRSLLSLAVVLVVTAVATHRATATVDIYDSQPGDRSSGIVMQGSTLLDSGFATLIRETIVDDMGNPRVKNATFLFQQCFGGGFIDNLLDELPTNDPRMSFVAASASRHDEVAFGLKSAGEIIQEGGVPPPNYPLGDLPNFWTDSLQPALANPSTTVHDAVGAAIINDPRGTFGGGPFRENGQRISVNGDAFPLGDPDAQSYHAVLIAGLVTHDAYSADVTRIYDTLADRWGDPATNANVSISVLFGNGMTDAADRPLPSKWNAQAATIDNLQSTLELLKPQLNRNEQFLVYVTDHGSSNGKITNLPPGLLPPGIRRNGGYGLSQSELMGYQLDTQNENPWVSVDYSYTGTPGSGESIDLFFNDVPIGSMVPQSGLNTFSVEVPENVLAANNIFSVENSTSQPIDISNPQFFGAALGTMQLLANGGKSGGLLEKSSWTGLGDGMSWENDDNWDGDSPNDINATARFDGFPDGLDVRFATDVISRVKVKNSDLRLDPVNGGLLNLPQSLRPDSLRLDPQLRLRDAIFDVAAPVEFKGEVMFRFRGSFGMLTFRQSIQANNKDLFAVADRETSGSLDFDADFVGGSNAGAAHFENVMVRITDSLTASGGVDVREGSISLMNVDSQLHAISLALKDAQLTLSADSNPLPDLQEAILMKGGTITRIAQGMGQVPVGVHLKSGISTIIGTAFGGSGGLDFQGPLTRDPHHGGVIRFNTFNTTYPIYFDSVQDAAANSPVFYATYDNDSTFADFNSTTGEIGPFTNYVTLNAAGPNEVVGLPGAQTTYSLTANTSAYAIRLGPGPFNTTLEGGGNTLTTNSMLVTNSAVLNNVNIHPPDREGDGPNELVTIAGANFQLTLSGTDVQDNMAPTDWTVAGARVVVNDALSKTGVTRLLGTASVTLLGANANLGGDQVNLGGRSHLRIVDNSVAQDVTAFPDVLGPTIDADGNSRLDGNVWINISTAGDRQLTLGAVNTNDSLTIAGTFQRTGSGNGAAGQGRADVYLGSSLLNGPIITEPTANLVDVGLSIHVFAPQLVHEGKLGQTELHDGVTASGNGSYLSLELSGDGSTVSPGMSIGTTPVTGDLVFGGTNNTYAAELTDDGQSDLLAVAGTLDLASDSDLLDLSFFAGTTLADSNYILATYSAVSGIFDGVMFDGIPVADPTVGGSIGGTHQLVYASNALLLATGPVGLDGDFDNSGAVENADLTLLLNNWAQPVPPVPAGWVGSPLTSPAVDNDELTALLNNWGTTAGAASREPTPEPTTLALCWIPALVAMRWRTHRRIVG